MDMDERSHVLMYNINTSEATLYQTKETITKTQNNSKGRHIIISLPFSSLHELSRSCILYHHHGQNDNNNNNSMDASEVNANVECLTRNDIQGR